MHQRIAASPGQVTEPSVAGETIAAISTAPGEGAIGIVRIAGENAIQVAETIFRGSQPPSLFESHRQHLGEIVAKGRTIDQVLLSVHRRPNSYTGEDLVEISCHGGTLVTAKVLETCLRAGARGARPGEFTERAYLNGKLDLTQAEAVIDIIRAQTDLALRSATEQLSGRLGQQFCGLRNDLIHTIAHVEAAIDFPEESISPDSVAVVRDRLTLLNKRITELIATAEVGRILREGMRVVIFGATNAGKSSLLNRLLGFDRAIVNEAHGTTRDAIEERINLRGIALRLFDTAGFREPENPIERESIERTERSLQTADLRLHVVDGSAARRQDFRTDSTELLVMNKTDLPEHVAWRETSAIRISCKTGAGLEQLEDAIFDRIGGARLEAQNSVAINARHRDQLRQAGEAITRAFRAIDGGATPEIFALELAEARHALDALVGDADEDAVRDAIFSEFCIGK